MRVELLSTGGTYRQLVANKVPVTEVTMPFSSRSFLTPYRLIAPTPFRSAHPFTCGAQRKGLAHLVPRWGERPLLSCREHLRPAERCTWGQRA